eukprot:202895-Karenia_brevis.AAC.1
MCIRDRPACEATAAPTFWQRNSRHILRGKDPHKEVLPELYGSWHVESMSSQCEMAALAVAIALQTTLF